MAVYQYEARSYDGRAMKGKMEANDEATVMNNLRQQNFYPVRIYEAKGGLNTDIGDIKKVSIKDISIFCRQFSTVITSGISILKGIEIVKEQTENKKLVAVLNDVFEDVQKGKSLSAAMKRHDSFPPMLINMIEVGEASGSLDTIMNRMAAYYDKEYKLNMKIKQALTYPIVVCIVAVVVVAFLVTKVIPTFAKMLTSSGSMTLPLPTRMVLGVSWFVRNRWYILVLIIAGIVGGIKYIGTTEDGRKKLDNFKLNMVVFGKINRKIVTSKFARTFGILMSSGVPLLQSITICSNVVGNVIMKDVLEKASEDIKKGSSIGDTLEKSQQFPPMLTQMIKIGEETGTLDEVLTKTSDFYDNEVETATSQLTSMIEPIIIIVLGAIVAFIILSIILPMFDMYDAMGKMQ